MAYRWRHLMWVLPLAGLLVGADIEWRKYQRSLQPSGEIEVIAHASLGSTPLFAGRFPLRRVEEIREIALSDEVLAAACEHAELSGKGEPLEKSIAELRSKIEFTPIPGSFSALISIRGEPSPQTRLMAEAVVRKTAWYADKTDYAERSRLLKKEESDLALMRKAIGNSFGGRGGPVEVKVGKVGEIEWNNSGPMEMPPDEQEYLRRKALLYDAALIHSRTKEPLRVKRWPSTPIPAPTTGQRLLAAAPTIIIATGSGILAAVVLAYLLEGLLPKKRERLEDQPA